MVENPKNLIICHTGIHLLKENEVKPMDQKTIAKELEKIGHGVGQSTITKILKYNPKKEKGKTVRLSTLKRVADGLKKLKRVELNMVFSEPELNFILTIENEENNQITYPYLGAQESNNAIYHAGGRMLPSEKISFMEQAVKGDTIIELGVRLNAFSNYFHINSDKNYKDRIRRILMSGVNLHCYMLNYRSDLAKFYFEKRATIQAPEKQAFKDMPNIVNRLRAIRFELNQEGYEGKMDLFHYEQFPEYHALRVGNQLLISHYLLGVRRSNSPVVELSKGKNPALFQRYLKSIKAVQKGAIRIK